MALVDFTRGYYAARDVLDDIDSALRAEFIEEELSETGRERGREITDEPEQFHLGWEQALRSYR